MKITYFTEKEHLYTCDDVRYESVSGLWKPYFKPFDGKNVSIKKAYKELDPKIYTAAKSELSYEHPDLIQFLKDNSSVDEQEALDLAQSYLDTWGNKAKTGTAFHAVQENLDYQNGYRVNPFTGKKCKVVKWDVKEGYDNQSSPYPLIEVPDGYIPELLIKNDDYLLAGQADQAYIETVGDVRYVDIDDWKTDGQILIKPSFFNRKTGYQKMGYPFDHVYETNYWKYAMKISTYAKMLELEGYTVRNLAFTHVVINDKLEILEETRYTVPYKSFEVDLALQFHKKNI